MPGVVDARASRHLQQSREALAATLEMKTVWHPIGR
jgi:hypothetical protein